MNAGAFTDRSLKSRHSSDAEVDAEAFWAVHMIAHAVQEKSPPDRPQSGGD
jgi:hypothetical protein